MTSLTKNIKTTISYLFFTLIFFTPLVLWPSTSELFEFNKMMLVYLFTIIITSLWLTTNILDKRLTLTRSLIVIPLLLFLSSQILSTIFSIDPHTSLWGYYSRFHGGLFSTISYLLLFYILLTHLNSLQNKQKQSFFQFFIYSLLASTTIISLWGTLEHFGVDSHLWIQDVQNRVFSTLGQPNWLSAYLLIILPLPIYLALKEKLKSRNFFIYTSLSLLFFITILFTKSRSGIGATFIILTLILIHQLVKNLKQKTLPRLGLFALALLILTLIIGSPWSPNPTGLANSINYGGPLWPQAESYLNRLHLTTQIKPLEVDRLPKATQEVINLRNQGVRYGGSSSFEIREVVWKGAIDLFKRNPILGTGVETFGYTYYWTRPKAHNLLSEWDFLYNKAHNEYLNFLATTGLVGFTSYLILIISFLVILIRFFRQQPNSPLAPTFLFGFISILITNFFGFSVVPVALLFFLYPALALSQITTDPQFFHLGPGWDLTQKQQKKLQKHQLQLKPDTLQYILITLISLIALYFSFIILRHWYADTQYAYGKKYSTAGLVGQALPALESAATLYPSEPNFHSELAETYAGAALAVWQQFEALPASQSALLKDQATAQRNQYAQKALNQIDIALTQNPYHLNLLKSKAKIELTLATFDDKYYQTALKTLVKANQLAPTDAKIVYNIGLIQLIKGDQNAATIAFQKALELKPDYQAAQDQLDQLSQ